MMHEFRMRVWVFSENLGVPDRDGVVLTLAQRCFSPSSIISIESFCTYNSKLCRRSVWRTGYPPGLKGLWRLYEQC